MKKNFVILFLIICLSLLFCLFFCLFFFENTLFLKLGEFSFLSLHQNGLAKILLNNDTDEDNYKYYLLGRINFIDGSLLTSIDDYNQAVKINPDFKEIYYGLGLDYGFLGKLFLDDALINFQKYVDLEKLEFQKTGTHAYGAWAGYNDLAWIYFQQEKLKEAKEVLNSGLSFS